MAVLYGKDAVRFAQQLQRDAAALREPGSASPGRADHPVRTERNYPVEAIGNISDATVKWLADMVFPRGPERRSDGT